MDNINDKTIRRFTKEEVDGRRKKSFAIAMVLIFLMVLFYIVTLVRFGDTLKNVKQNNKQPGEATQPYTRLR